MERTMDAQVGERLRAIRRQKGLSLHDVEARSDQEFKASVLGAYERGERAHLGAPPRPARGAVRGAARSVAPARGRRRDRSHRARSRPRATASPSTSCACTSSTTPTRQVLARYAVDDPAAAPGLQRPHAHDPPRRPPGPRRGARTQSRRAREPARASSACAHVSPDDRATRPSSHATPDASAAQAPGTLGSTWPAPSPDPGQGPRPGQPPHGGPARPARRAAAPGRGRVPRHDPRARQRDHGHAATAEARAGRSALRGAGRCSLEAGPRARP